MATKIGLAGAAPGISQNRNGTSRTTCVGAISALSSSVANAGVAERQIATVLHSGFLKKEGQCASIAIADDANVAKKRRLSKHLHIVLGSFPKAIDFAFAQSAQEASKSRKCGHADDASTRKHTASFKRWSVFMVKN